MYIRKSACGWRSRERNCPLDLSLRLGVTRVCRTLLATPTDLMKLGQTIVFDIYPAEAGGGYYYDFTRTWSLGYATPEAQELFDQVKEIYEQLDLIILI